MTFVCAQPALRRWLVLLCAAGFFVSAPALAQIGMSLAPTGPAKSAVTELPLAEQQALVETSLKEIQRQRDELEQVPVAADSEGPTPRQESKRLLDRLRVLQTDKLKRLNDIAALEQAGLSAPASPQVDRLIAKLGDTPPYATLDVDALRDELDHLRERLQVLNASLEVRESEKRDRLAQRQRAAEAVRLAQDRLAQAKASPAVEEAQSRLGLANLQQQVADAELGLAAIDQDWLKKQAAILTTQIDALQVRAAHAIAQQQLSAQELEQQRERIQAQHRALAAEIDSVAAKHLKHTEEREKRSARLANETTLPRRQLLDQQLETDTALLQGLKGLQLILDAARGAWEARYVALSTTSATERQQALATLGKFHLGLTSRKRLLHEAREATRVVLREQENRIANLAQDDTTMRHERQILALMQQRAAVYERVELAAGRLERQLARWIGDLSAPHARSLSLRAADLAATLKHWLGVAWQYELFAVEDVSEIDGRPVTVSYGVTLGKSIGALLLFAFGYWLFSLLAGMLERILVGRFGINAPLAKVIRRWMMISLAVVLVILVLNLARIPLTVFAFMGGALAIGVGFGTQNIIKNFISGIIILFERKIRVGDIIESGGMTGQVTAVDLRATTVRGFDGVEALVPNSSFLEQQVINWTYSNQQIRREIKVGVAYGSDTRQAAEVLLNVALNNPDVMQEPPAEVLFDDFADSALLLTLVFWVELGKGKTGRQIDSALRHALYRALNENGIAIPFPQRDLHFDPAQTLSVSLVSAGHSPVTGASA